MIDTDTLRLARLNLLSQKATARAMAIAADDILSEWHDCEGSYFANDKEKFPPLW